MKGNITRISGPTVRVDIKGLKLYERVFVGEAMLTGEVVGIEESGAVVQVYEDTRGLAVGETVRATGMPLTVRLGPGLLSGIFDGLQRPLQRLMDASGPFITSAGEMPALDASAEFEFHPLKKTGEHIGRGEPLGYVMEGRFKHYLSCPHDKEGRISWAAEKAVKLDKPVFILEDGTELYGFHDWPVRIPTPFKDRHAPSGPLITGQRTIDFLFTIARGGNAVMPGGFGTGKTILEQSIAKFADVDIVVYVGCGERGNEMAELIDEFRLLEDPWTERKLMERTILCVNTSNMPVAAREASIYTAVTMAEYYRNMGYHVLFLADSISRWAEALREISSSLEELPGEEGYPTYLASRLSGFLERSGVVETAGGTLGSLSMILSVSPPGGDFTEPVTQSCLRTSGAFLMLDTSLAHRRHFPAINWFQSYSLYGGVPAHGEHDITAEWERAKAECRDILQKEESLREVAEIVGAEGLQDADRLIMHTAEVIRTTFLSQNAYTEDAFSTPEQTLARIKDILDRHADASKQLDEGVPLDDVFRKSEERGSGEAGR